MLGQDKAASLKFHHCRAFLESSMILAPPWRNVCKEFVWFHGVQMASSVILNWQTGTHERRTLVLGDDSLHRVPQYSQLISGTSGTPEQVSG